MRAVVQSGYGEPERVLSTGVLPRPGPAADEVLVEVAAASVHADVWHVVTGQPWVLRAMGPGLRRPRRPVPGTDMAGTVVDVGASVQRFAVGDIVFGETPRGSQWNNGGTWAELVATPAEALARVPEGIDPVAAATVPTAGLIVLQNLAGIDVGPGSRVLVNGAAGGVGAIAVQVLRARGAHVTGVDHTERIELLEQLGSDVTLDYTTTNASATGGPYDLVFDIPGNHLFRSWRRLLTPTGTYVLIAHDAYGRTGRRVLGSIPRMVGLMARSLWSPHLHTDMSRIDRSAGMRELANLLAAGQLTPVVGPQLALEEAVGALRLLEQGTSGRIVLLP